jgi:DNA modification methylase
VSPIDSQNMNHQLHHGDCLEVLKTMADNSVDSIVTDPPYGLSFMGKKWDYDVPSEDVWRECLRVLKPGGHLLAFAGTRTQHRMAVRIEDAGFEIRDMIAWVYGSGFPKSLDVSKAIDKAAGAEREVVGEKLAGIRCKDLPISTGQGEFTSGQSIVPITAPATEAAKQWQGWGTALKPALEPITVARKPLGEKTVAANVLAHGTGGLNVDGCRVGSTVETWPASRARPANGQPNALYTHRLAGQTATQTVSTGDAPSGRWPANLIHDGSDEVVGLFPQTTSGKPMKRMHTDPGCSVASGAGLGGGGEYFHDGYGDTGSAARFFKECQHEEIDLLFCRAKAILHAWQLNQKIVSAAESNSCLSRQAAAFVLSNAVIAASQGGKLLSDVKGLSTTVTEHECEMLCETLTTAILILKSDALPAPSPVAPIQNGCLVNIATTPKQTGTTTITISLPKSGGYAEPVMFSITPMSAEHGEADFASRFRYCAKASKKDREGSTHPTMKPTALMRYLCRLVTPPEGIVLDPFMGSGSTGKAAVLEGFEFIGIEREAEYLQIAKARIEREPAQKQLL